MIIEYNMINEWGKHIMMSSWYVLIGSGVGGLTRFWVSRASYAILGTNMPWGTFVVNVIGSLVMGLLSVLLAERFISTAPWLQPLLLIGFLGGFTTFSSFSIETLHLLESGRQIGFAINILLNVILCIAAAWCGVIIGRQL